MSKSAPPKLVIALLIAAGSILAAPAHSRCLPGVSQAEGAGSSSAAAVTAARDGGRLSASPASIDEPADVTLPDTPAGRQFAAFLTALESSDHEAYIKQHFSAGFLNAFPLERHLEFFRDMRALNGGFTVGSIEESSDYRIVVLARAKKRDVWRRIDMSVEPEPPYKVASFGIEAARSPEEEQIPEIETEDEALKYIQATLGEESRADRFSGAVLVAKDGEPLFRRAYGEASKEFSVPNRPDTKFNLGSINKIFTSLAIAQLLESGEVGLDDAIGKYLGDLPDGWGEKITVRQLLTMRSGLGHYWNEAWENNFAKIRTVDALMDVVVQGSLSFEPGTSKQYSNSGYVVLGAIIESVTGKSYYDYVRENIFEPAGMPDTDSYEIDQIVPNLARGYTQNRSEHPYKDKRLQENFFLHSVKGSPAGGGFSTVDDLNRFVEALKGNRLAGERYTNMVLGLFENADSPETRPKGLGIAGGASVGINAIVEADFPSGYTVIVLSNYDPPAAERLGIRFMKVLRGLGQAE
jgi:CubicO group peptidase (beta-lactamase class C family)